MASIELWIQWCNAHGPPLPWTLGRIREPCNMHVAHTAVNFLVIENDHCEIPLAGWWTNLCGGDSHNSSLKSLGTTQSPQGQSSGRFEVLSGRHRGESFYKQVTLATKVLGPFFCLQVQNMERKTHTRRSCFCVKAEAAQVFKKPGRCPLYQLRSDNYVNNFSPWSITTSRLSKDEKIMRGDKNGVYSSLFRAKASGGHSKARETRDAQFLQKFTRFALIGRGPARPRVCKCPPSRIPLSQSPF